MSATIGKLIELARAQGLVDHTIPGVTINSFGDGLAIAFNDATPTGFSHEGIAALVATIRDFVNGTAQSKMVHNLDHDFSVSRQGTSFKVAVPVNGPNVKTWSADIAMDFADLIEVESVKADVA